MADYRNILARLKERAKAVETVEQVLQSTVTNSPMYDGLVEQLRPKHKLHASVSKPKELFNIVALPLPSGGNAVKNGQYEESSPYCSISTRWFSAFGGTDWKLSKGWHDNSQKLSTFSLNDLRKTWDKHELGNLNQEYTAYLEMINSSVYNKENKAVSAFYQKAKSIAYCLDFIDKSASDNGDATLETDGIIRLIEFPYKFGCGAFIDNFKVERKNAKRFRREKVADGDDSFVTSLDHLHVPELLLLDDYVDFLNGELPLIQFAYDTRVSGYYDNFDITTVTITNELLQLIRSNFDWCKDNPLLERRVFTPLSEQFRSCEHIIRKDFPDFIPYFKNKFGSLLKDMQQSVTSDTATPSNSTQQSVTSDTATPSNSTQQSVTSNHIMVIGFLMYSIEGYEYILTSAITLLENMGLDVSKIKTETVDSIKAFEALAKLRYSAEFDETINFAI